MSGITTHVLDTSEGKPAEGVPIVLEKLKGSAWSVLGKGKTDADGRCKTLVPAAPVEAGAYRLTFDVAAYFKARGKTGFYTSIPIEFQIEDGAAHYHVPLLLSPFGYSTYRGS